MVDGSGRKSAGLYPTWAALNPKSHRQCLKKIIGIVAIHRIVAMSLVTWEQGAYRNGVPTKQTYSAPTISYTI